MSWKDRIRSARYTSPSGRSTAFIFADFTQTITAKTTAFEFPGANGTFVQDNGRSGRRVPLEAIFSGENCDLEADDFVAMLGETGQGKLNHPRYGVIDVVPVGDISRTDPLVTGANEVRVSVEFYETTGIIWPLEGPDFGSLTTSALSAARFSSATAFSGGLRLRKPGSLVGVQMGFMSKLASASTTLRRLGNAPASTVDGFLLSPLNTAFTVAVALSDPARGLALLQDKLNAYGNLLASIIGIAKNVPSAGQVDESKSVNSFQVNDFFAGNYVLAMAESANYSTFSKRSDIFAALDFIESASNSWGSWRDQVNGNLSSFVDQDEPAAGASKALGLLAGKLIELSFSTAQERVFVTKETTNPIELAWELYGDLGKIEQLISTNNLGGDLLWEIPPGKEIRYYVGG